MSDPVSPQTDPSEEAPARYRSQISDMMLWAGIVYWEYDVAKSVFEPSADFAATYGYKPEEFYPLTIDRWKQIIHPDDQQYVLSMFEKVIVGHSDTVDAVYRMRIASGEWRYFRSRGGIIEISTADKTTVRISGTLQDITDQKIASMKIQRRDRLLAAVNDAASILLTATTRNFDQSISEVLHILGLVTEADRVYVHSKTCRSPAFCLTHLAPLAPAGYNFPSWRHAVSPFTFGIVRKFLLF